MKIARRSYDWNGDNVVAYFVYCPACACSHRFIVEAKEGPVWTFNGSEDSPTFRNSLLVKSRWWEVDKWIDRVCHSYLTDGVWRFLSDCTHGFAGKEVPMVDFPENYKV